jgi:hypothetical protein
MRTSHNTSFKQWQVLPPYSRPGNRAVTRSAASPSVQHEIGVAVQRAPAEAKERADLAANRSRLKFPDAHD